MFYLTFIQASLSTNNHQIRNLKLLPIPLDERDPNINKIILKDREHVKIQNQEQTNIMPSIVTIEIISMHETTKNIPQNIKANKLVPKNKLE